MCWLVIDEGAPVEVTILSPNTHDVRVKSIPSATFFGTDGVEGDVEMGGRIEDIVEGVGDVHVVQGLSGIQKRVLSFVERRRLDSHSECTGSVVIWHTVVCTRGVASVVAILNEIIHAESRIGILLWDVGDIRHEETHHLWSRLLTLLWHTSV